MRTRHLVTCRADRVEQDISTTMSRREKLRKTKKQSKKHKKEEDKSKIINCADEQECEEPRGEELTDQTPERSSKTSKNSKTSKTPRREKSAKQVHIAFLPDRYEPLEEDQAVDAANEEAARKKHAKYKKFRKNVGKAFRYSWKCLVVGLQSFSTAYSGPLSAAATLVPEIQRPRA